MSERRSSGLFGFVLIGIGLIYFGANVGWWSATTWTLLISYWPVLLILVGLNMILRSAVVTTTLGIIIVGAILVGANVGRYQTLDVGSPELKAQTRNLTQDLVDGTTKFHLKFELGAIKISLGSLEDSNTSKLLEGISISRQPFRLESTTSGETAAVVIRDPVQGFTLFGLGRRDLDLRISQRVALEIAIKSGAADLDLDWTNLNVPRFSLEAGASNDTLTFGTKADKVEGTIKTGASSLTIRVPKDTGLKIDAQTGLTSKNFEAVGLTKSGNMYVTDGFEAPVRQIAIKLEAGASAVTLERY